jgi:xanthine dehydrogenase accessory factor
MKDIADILALWEQLQGARESAVLATVVRTQGSSYRTPGARMLLTRTGKRAGAVSGGCLEDDLVKKAWWLTEKGPVIRRYDTTPDGELATSGYGLGCSGIIHVLLERITPQQPSVLPLIRKVRSERQTELIRHLHPQDGSEVFVERVTPPIRLLVFGAGDDAVPMVDLAHFLGWETFVLDGRAHYARREKFANANEVLVRPQGGVLCGIKVDSWTAAVIMNHSFNQDMEVLRELVHQPLIYLGILGPRKRTEQLLSDAGLTTKQLGSRVHTPMGLDIGAEGSQQVALSVLAEIQAAINERDGGRLRDRNGAIHAREAQGDRATSWVQSIVCA